MTATELGRIAEINRYPVKSMAGTSLGSAPLGWHGIEGDRRFAFRRVGDTSDFPWLTASKLPALIRYRPEGTHVRSPSGASLPLIGAELAAELSGRFGSAVELMQLKQGIFDEAAISVISLATVAGIGAEVGRELDPRRFRANIVLNTPAKESFLENGWVGRMLVFGEDDQGPAVQVTKRDPRCVMINLDPETAEQDPRVLKTVVRLNEQDAGVYATVVRRGTIAVGDRVSLV